MLRYSLMLQIVGVCTLAAACGPPPPPVRTTLRLPALQVHDQAEVTKDGITVSVTPILTNNEASFPEVFKRLTWRATRKNIFGKLEEYEAAVEGTIVPKPAFKVRVTNNTGHVIRFTTVVFRLQDNTGKTYPLVSGTPELQSWLENQITTAYGPMVLESVRAEITSALSSLQLLNRTVELLNGDEWSGYLAFNLGIDTPQALDEFMNRITRLTLRLAEVPVETSEAGQVTRTTEFTFHLDKASAELAVICPAGTKQPSLAVCERDW